MYGKPRARWLGYVVSLNPNRIPRKKKRGRPKKKRLEAVKMDLKNIGVKLLVEKARDRDKWRKTVETIEHTNY
ncbi:hypothetical protein QE152_g1262 [Popillia japonica]|uniref:Uncharacterized protein n=1 Tax=Popillia japonica TaxID=7064 RepID=A0AAW1N3L7_POPJA